MKAALHCRRLLVRYFVALAAGLALTACAEALKPIAQPEDGYDAVLFKQTVEVVDHTTINTFIFTAGSLFISDRTSDRGKVYCGRTIRSNAMVETCIRIEMPQTIFVQAGAQWSERAREVPPGTLELTKAKM